MHRVSAAVSIIITFLLIFSVYFSRLYYSQSGDEASRRISVLVPPGATFKEVQNELVAKGILTRPGVFRWAAFLSGREKKIKSGRYIFRRGESVASVLNKLVGGEVDLSRIVIPEGLMLSEIASILYREAEVDSVAFLELCGDSAFLAEMGIEAPSLEGYIFPDTYLFDWPLNPRKAAVRMVYRFWEIFETKVRTEVDSLEFNLNEIVTLASIIQAEAVYRSEMPRISAVYHNRLRAGWKLEADPTVAYALGGVRRKLWYKDLRIDSPYNTYRVTGLPPGAICNPGRSALVAAIRPHPQSKDYYFVADGSGKHKFSRTYGEHLKAKHLIKYGPVPPHIKRKPDPETSAPLNAGSSPSAREEEPQSAGKP
ncbi:MAG: endolytic transglycosylase MltG [Candidatus Krumholzibacteriota bacterium]|nr:endolytic transglycosylase MltG [Candidatus Krumholzibacteriota bacterium]